jgi:hypothetical protein
MRRPGIGATIAALCAITFCAIGQESGPNRTEIKQSMKSRYASLMKLKKAGTVGETTTGLVEVTGGEADDSVKALVKAENADRKRLYTLIAEETGTTPKEVAGNNALRLFKKASPEIKFKTREGEWKTKGELKNQAP